MGIAANVDSTVAVGHDRMNPLAAAVISDEPSRPLLGTLIIVFGGPKFSSVELGCYPNDKTVSKIIHRQRSCDNSGFKLGGCHPQLVSLAIESGDGGSVYIAFVTASSSDDHIVIDQANC